MTELINNCQYFVRNARANGRIREHVTRELLTRLEEMQRKEQAHQEVLREVRECGLYNRRVSQTLWRKVKAITED